VQAAKKEAAAKFNLPLVSGTRFTRDLPTLHQKPLDHLLKGKTEYFIAFQKGLHFGTEEVTSFIRLN
jgi:hypothetical protein